MSNREFHEQVKFINWCVSQKGCKDLPHIDHIFSIPNGAHVTKAQRGKLVSEGMRAGVSDMFLPVPRNGYHGLWLEMKAPEIRHHRTNNILKPKGATKQNQKDWLKNMHDRGYACGIVYGKLEAINAILSYYGVMQLPSGKVIK